MAQQTFILCWGFVALLEIGIRYGGKTLGAEREHSEDTQAGLARHGVLEYILPAGAPSIGYFLFSNPCLN